MFFRLLHVLPKNLISHWVGIITHKRLPFSLHTAIKLWFIKRYGVDVVEAEFPVEHYQTLGDLFIRHLKPGARPISSATMVSPVDGTYTMGGPFQSSQPMLTQIKGIDYRLEDLVGPGWDLQDYLPGGFMTVYLAPFNYHRIHSPVNGQVTQVSYIPGALWPVNTWSVKNIPGLFVVNERITVEVSGPDGKVLVVMVGATNVGRITLDFNSEIVGNKLPRPKASQWRPSQPIPISKGQGLGCFELGSTVILILSKSLQEEVDKGLQPTSSTAVRLGQGLTH